MNSDDIKEKLKYIGGYTSTAIPEFTWDNRLRVDMLLIDTHKRWLRGFEIKLTKADFLNDYKWTQYTEFCSSITIVCPAGLIKKEEIEHPFGLLWITQDNQRLSHKWIKRPKNIQTRNSLAWLWTYIRVLEYELPRLSGEVNNLKWKLKNYV